MSYLDFERLAAIDPVAYQTRAPYPYANPEGLLRPDAFQRLVDNLPPTSLFEEVQGKKRAHGQRPHDRLALEYEPGLPLPAPWQEFIDELQGSEYKRLLCRLVGAPSLELRFHWHWATTGNSVSPHCDRQRKLGSHIFYLNTESDWQAEWGGETIVLDDSGRFTRNSAPKFADFDNEIHAQAIGNWSFIFTRRGNSWHGVQEITCPAGAYRKVFIAVIDKPRIARRVRDWIVPNARISSSRVLEPRVTTAPST